MHIGELNAAIANMSERAPAKCKKTEGNLVRPPLSLAARQTHARDRMTNVLIKHIAQVRKEVESKISSKHQIHKIQKMLKIKDLNYDERTASYPIPLYNNEVE